MLKPAHTDTCGSLYVHDYRPCNWEIDPGRRKTVIVRKARESNSSRESGE